MKRTVRDSEGEIYWIVEAEAAPPTETEANGRCQSMSYFMVTPKAVGGTLEAAFESYDDELAVAIGDVIDQSILDSGSFESSQARFFAIGYLGFIRNRFDKRP